MNLLYIQRYFPTPQTGAPRAHFPPRECPDGYEFAHYSLCSHIAVTRNPDTEDAGNCTVSPEAKVMNQSVSYLWREPKAADGFTAGVSLHSHTNQSQETL